VTLRALTEQKRYQDFEKVNPGTAMLREANRLLNKDEYARKSVKTQNGRSVSTFRLNLRK